MNLPTFPTMAEAQAEAKRQAKETGDIWSVREYQGKFVAYMMGFDFPGPDEDDEEE